MVARPSAILLVLLLAHGAALPAEASRGLPSPSEVSGPVESAAVEELAQEVPGFQPEAGGIEASGWGPLPQVSRQQPGNVLSWDGQALGILDTDRVAPRAFDVEYRWFGPEASPLGAVLEVGITPVGDDHGGTVAVLSMPALATALGLAPGGVPKVTVASSHAAETPVVEDVAAGRIELAIPHFSTVWLTVASGTINTLWDVGGAYNDNMWAVGLNTMLHYNGATWSSTGAPASPGDLRAVEADPSERFVAAGAGKVWTKTASGSWVDRGAPFGANVVVSDIEHVAGEFWMAGTDYFGGSCPSGCKAFVGRFAFGGSSPGFFRVNTLPSPDGIELRGISAIIAPSSPVLDIWAVGEDHNPAVSRAAMYNGPNWQLTLDSRWDARLTVDALDWNEVYMGGRNADLQRFDGDSWDPFTASQGSGDTFLDLRMVTGRIGWASGSFGGNIHQLLDGTILPTPIGTTRQLVGMHDFGVHDVWAVGQQGLIMHYTGQRPSQAALYAPDPGAVVASSGTTLVAGASTDRDLDPITYRFYLGTSFADVAAAAPSTLRCSTAGLTCGTGPLTSNADYYWQVQACDDVDGCRGSPVRQFETNTPPYPCITSLTTDNLWVYVDSSCSYDPDGDPITKVWDWGDGSPPLTASAAGHNYQPAICPEGDFTVTLTVTDARGAAAWTTWGGHLTDTRDDDIRFSQVTGATAEPDGVVRCREDLQRTDDVLWDTDGDGLSDAVESQWLDEIAGDPGLRNSLFCNAAATVCERPSPIIQDAYIEVDHMTGLALDPQVVPSVRAAFAAHAIRLHVDTGQLGGGGTELPLEPATANIRGYRDAGMSPERRSIYHHATVACRSANTPDAAGQAMAPGDRFVVYQCTMDEAGDPWEEQARTFMQEFGHNAFGFFVAPHAACPAGHFTNWHNPGLAHFESPASPGADSCDGDNTVEVYYHAVVPDDAMSYGASHQVDFEPDTWAALQLPWGLEPERVAAANCQQETPSELLGLGLPNVLHDLGLVAPGQEPCSFG